MIFLFGESQDQLSQHLQELLKKTSELAIKERGVFKIGVSGGSVVNILTNAVLSLDNFSSLAKWKFFFCDERIVPDNSPDSTFNAYKTLIDNSQLTEMHFMRIDPGLNAKEAAEHYIHKMKRYFPNDKIPVFDFLLLGMGPDGHTCSLFPNHPLLKETEAWIAPIVDAPKLPPQRITMTMPVLNNARNCTFVISGSSKADMAKKVFIQKDQQFPAARVNPTSGKLYVIIESGLIENTDS